MSQSLSFVIAFLFITLALPAQEKHTLRYDLKPGATVWMQMVQEMTQNTSRDGKETKIAMTTTMLMEGKATEVKDGVATIEQRYARIQLKCDSPMLKIDFDSDVEGSKPGQFRNVTDFVGKTGRARVDAQGKMIEFTLSDDIAEDMAGVAVNLKRRFEQQFVAFPRDPVAVGESWQSAMDFPMDGMGTMKATITNKLLALQDGVVTVEQTMVMDTSGLKLPTGLKIEVPKASGVTKIALRAFMPVEVTMDMEMKKTGSENVTVGMRIVMKQVAAPLPRKAAEKPAEAPKK